MGWAVSPTSVSCGGIGLRPPLKDGAQRLVVFGGEESVADHAVRRIKDDADRRGLAPILRRVEHHVPHVITESQLEPGDFPFVVFDTNKGMSCARNGLGLGNVEIPKVVWHHHGATGLRKAHDGAALN